MKKTNVSFKILLSVILIIILVVIYIFYNKKTSYSINNQKAFDNKKNKEKVNIENNKNDNEVGSIYIDGTSIDDVIMQSSDNQYYLTHNSKGEYDVLGSIFMDYRNTLDDRKILLFGHNAKKLTNSPFHDLEKYVDYSFYKDHKYIDLILNNEKSKWQIFSVMIVNNNTTKHMKIEFNDEEWIEHISWIKNNSLYDTNIDVGVENKIIVLQTCYYEKENTYLLIIAKN